MAGVNEKRKVNTAPSSKLSPSHGRRQSHNAFAVSPAILASDLQQRVQLLEAQLAAERAMRYQLAAQHRLNPDRSKGLLDALPIDVVTLILEEVLVQDHALHLNNLLVKPPKTNVKEIDGYHVAIRRAMPGYDWAELARAPSQREVGGKFWYDAGDDRWVWHPNSEYVDMWSVINVCKVFRQIGIPLPLGKNTWVLNPVWSPSKEFVQRYWCVRVGKYRGPWTGDNGVGEDGVPFGSVDLHVAFRGID